MAADTNTTITLGQFGDDLAAHARRRWALSAALSGLGRTIACEEDLMFAGVDQMVNDIALEAKRLSDALLTKVEACVLAAERERIAALVETLINISDQGDGDTDIETDCDFEADHAERSIADLDALALYQKEAEERAAALEARLQAERLRMVANAVGPASAA